MSLTTNGSGLSPLSRRALLRFGALQLGAFGLSAELAGRLQREAWGSEPGAAESAGEARLAARSGRAARAPRRCIVLFAWGGMSHLDTWDPKPEGGSEVAGEFRPIATKVPGIVIGEHLPQLARRMDRLAVVRSVHHRASDHREAAYWNLTGHEPLRLGVAAVPPTREDWPCLGSQVAFARRAAQAESGNGGGREVARALPGTCTLPYPAADRGLLNGQYGGFLGGAYDPLFFRPGEGKPYQGVSPEVGTVDLRLAEGVDAERLQRRREFLEQLERCGVWRGFPADAPRFRGPGLDMLLDARVRSAFAVDSESPTLRSAYGDHICGQSTLVARRLSEAGVPLVTVFCNAGDLNGSAGQHWDTHGDNFNRLKRDLLPPLDRAMAALLDDLAARGLLEETLVVLLTEFGRTPKVNGGAGRDHFPNCYSVVFAGGGIRGGQAHGRSNATGSEPAESPCTPEDLHATILRQLGIDPQTTVVDLGGRPHPLCAGTPLPLG